MTLAIHWVNQYAVPPDQPGGTRHYDMAKELRRRGHDVRVVASDLNLTTRSYSRRRSGRDLRRIDEDVDGVPFTWLTAGSYTANDWRRVASMTVFGLGVVVHLIRVPKRPGTVFIGSSPQLFAALGAWAAALVRRVPFVLEVRDLWPESYTAVSGKGRGAEITMMRLVADWLYRRAALVVVLAEGSIDAIAERGVPAARIVHVPNGVDMASFTAASSAAAPSLHEPGTSTFVYAGAHGPANGLDVVLRAAELLQGRGRDDIRVVLLGDGPVKAELRSLADELQLRNVRFEDPVPKDAVGATLRTADAGLMILADVELFRHAVSPNKLFDYLAAGLPVVTNVPGLVSRIVEAADAGISAAPGDPVALAAAMESMVARHDDDGAVERRRRFVEDNYDRRALAQRLDAALASITR